MKESLVAELQRDYPLLFTKLSYIECGSGWYGILRELCRSLYNHVMKEHGEPVYFTQIKEKFGTLRVYVDGGDQISSSLIREAEQKSAKVCEKCGKAGRLRKTKGWVFSRCDTDWEEVLSLTK